MFHVTIKHRLGKYADTEHEFERLEITNNVGGTTVLLDNRSDPHNPLLVDLDYYDLLIQISRKP